MKYNLLDEIISCVTFCTAFVWLPYIYDCAFRHNHTMCGAARRLNPNNPSVGLLILLLKCNLPHIPPTYWTAQVNQCFSIVCRQRYARHHRCHGTKGHATPHVSLTFPLRLVIAAVARSDSLTDTVSVSLFVPVVQIESECRRAVLTLKDKLRFRVRSSAGRRWVVEIKAFRLSNSSV